MGRCAGLGHRRSASDRSLGNRFLCRPADAVELRTRMLSAQLTEYERIAHVVSDVALAAVRAGNWNDFIAIRLEEIVALEQDFVGALLARHPTVSSNQSTSSDP